MKSAVRTAPVFQRILYAQAWEDPRVDRTALRIGADDDVFTIAAAGDNALALLLDEPRSITALDFNLSQCCLMELKMAALATLTHGELLEFLGVRSSPRRSSSYRRLQERLSPAARRYWDGHPQTIQRGVLHCGRFERYFGLFRRFVLPFAHRRRTCDAFLACETLEEQRSFYRTRWNTRTWRAIFRVFFGRFAMGRLGRDPAMFRYVDDDVAGAIFARAEHGLTQIPVRTNWFLEYILRGNYRTETRLPPYLREEHQPTLRRLLPRVRIVNDELERFLPDQPDGAYHKFSLSDVFEYMSEDAAERLLTELWRCAAAGGILSWREMMVPRPVPVSLRDRFENDEERGAWCHANERAFFYGAHRVVTVRKEGAPPARPS
jgi:S-adenosylmethionine-diacylglycerol 3-amino-3-carboxypropyl transferase